MKIKSINMKSKIYLFTSLFLVYSTIVNAQTPSWNWSANAGNSGNETGWGTCSDVSGNSYLIGSFSSSTMVVGGTTLTNAGSSSSDIFLIKYDSAGTVEWAKSYGTSNSDEGRYVAVDDSGNVYITGHFNGASLTMGSFTLTNNGNDDIFIAKLNPSGTVIWATGIGNVNDNRPDGLILDLSGNVAIIGGYTNASLVIGTFTLTNAGDFDFFIAMFNNGNGQPGYAQGFGGTGRDDAHALALNKSSGFYYVGGRFDSPSLTLGSTTLTNSNVISFDAFVFEFNNSQTVTWANSYATSQVNGLSHHGSSNTLYVCGEFSDSLLIIETDTLVNTSTSGTDAFVFSSTNNVHNWALSFGGSDNDAAYGLATSSANQTAMSGVFNGTNITFGSTVLTNANAGTNDLYVAGLSPAGSADWALRAGNSGDDFAFGLHASSQDDIYVAGWYSLPSITFGTLPVMLNAGGDDAFIARIGGIGTGINVVSSADELSVYPNPSNGNFTFINPTEGSLLIQIFNSNAQLIYEKLTAEKNINVDLSVQPKGIYFYNINSQNFAKSGKLIKN